MVRCSTHLLSDDADNIIQKPRLGRLTPAEATFRTLLLVSFTLTKTLFFLWEKTKQYVSGI